MILFGPVSHFATFQAICRDKWKPLPPTQDCTLKNWLGQQNPGEPTMDIQKIVKTRKEKDLNLKNNFPHGIALLEKKAPRIF